MALDSYDELVTSLQNWLIRVGLQELVDQIPELVGLCDEEMRKRLRIRQLRYRAEAVHNEEYEWLPGDFAKMISVAILHKADSNGIRMETPVDPKSNTQFDQMPIARSLSYGRYYTIIGKQIRFRPAPATVEESTPEDQRPLFRLIYYATDNPLSSVTQVNEILAAYPSLYLWGSLSMAGMFVREAPEWVGVWGSNFEKSLATANEDSKEAEYSGPTSRSAPR